MLFAEAIISCSSTLKSFYSQFKQLTDLDNGDWQETDVDIKLCQAGLWYVACQTALPELLPAVSISVWRSLWEMSVNTKSGLALCLIDAGVTHLILPSFNVTAKKMSKRKRTSTFIYKQRQCIAYLHFSECIPLFLHCYPQTILADLHMCPQGLQASYRRKGKTQVPCQTTA